MAVLQDFGDGIEDSLDAARRAAASGTGRLVTAVGAAMSVALVAGLGVWGYRLLVRDVTGIPVVRAIEGPMRVQPDDPGGDRAAHQGLAVNRIAALGDAAPPADEIVLAPRSADLEAEDLSQGALRHQAVLAAAEPAAAPEAPVDPVEAAILEATTQVLTAEADLSGDLEAALLAEVIPASVPGPSRSLRPRPRPEGDFASAPVVASPTSVTSVGEVDSASLTAGTLLVQFGAYDSAEEARAVWSALAGRFGALMEGKERVIEEASTGGRTFYRLRALGFDDQADSRRFCAAFVAERADCIPVTTR